MPKTINPESTYDTKGTNLKMRTRAQRLMTTMSWVIILVSAKILLTNGTGFRRLICTNETCSILLISGYFSIWWTGSKGLWRTTVDCRLSTTFGRHYTHTQDTWFSKNPTARWDSGKGKRCGIWGAVFWEFSMWLFASQDVHKQCISNLLSDTSGCMSTLICWHNTAATCLTL